MLRAFSSLLSAMLALSGCGMLTGLSDDYTFVDAGTDASASPSDGGTSDDATTADGAASCTVSLAASVRPICVSSCFKEPCCAVAACQADPACNAYLTCRLGCKSNNTFEACMKRCDDEAQSGARNMLGDAVRACGVSEQCRSYCNLAF